MAKKAKKRKSRRLSASEDDEKDRSRKAKKRKSRRLSTSASEDDEKGMAKKAKKRKSRRLSASEDDEKDRSRKAKKKKSRRRSTSSSEDDEKRPKNTKETTKRKHVSSKEKRDVTVRKSKDPRSSKEEVQGKHQIKKPEYKLKKSQPTRGQSPIFEKESKSKAKHSVRHAADISSKLKNSENSSSKDGRGASFSPNIFIPRSICSRQKSEGHCSSVTKKHGDVSPPTVAPKAMEAEKSSLVSRVIPTSALWKNEPLKKTQLQQEQKNVKTEMKSTFSPIAFLKGPCSKTQSSPRPLHFKIPKKSLVVNKSALARKSLSIKEHHKNTSHGAKSSGKVEPSLRQNRTPVAVAHIETNTALVPSIKTTKVSPGHKKDAMVLHQPPSTLTNSKILQKTCATETSPEQNNKTISIKRDHVISTCEASTSVPQSSSGNTTSSKLDVQKQDPWTFFTNAEPSPWQDQMMVVEQLHQARSEKLLEVDVMQSCGELTCMEIDPPEEGAADTLCKDLPPQDVIIVLDTNILISHLDYVKRIVSRGLEVFFPLVLVPWVVLQELESLKKGRGLSGSVAHAAVPAISYLNNCLKGKESRLWGQSMQQAAESTKGLNAENNDDRVLQCCLQYQLLYPECAVILCTNDKNLCNKALVSGVKAFSKTDLETEVARSSQGIHLLQSLQDSNRPQAKCSISPLAPGKVHAPAEAQGQEKTSLSVEKENNQPQEASTSRTSSCYLGGLVCQFESVLQEALSGVLEAEMKAAYEDLWLEVVYRKPPWSLRDVLQCLKKHWIAVFGHVVPRDKLQNVLNLSEFFSSGKGVDQNSTLVALLEAKDLLKECVKSSSRVPCAISAVDIILNTFQTQGETLVNDVVMKEAEEDKQPTSSPVSHAEVWNLFGSSWQHVYQTSIEVFKAVDFDPKASQSARPAGGPPPPQDVVACLHKLQCMVSQLLGAFSSFLTSTALPEAQSLLNVMRATEIVNVDKVTASDLLNCFSQEEYRERLRAGGSQLLEVQAALNNCVEFTSGSVPFTVPP